MAESKCPIWPDETNQTCTITEVPDGSIVVNGSIRAGGKYEISTSAHSLVASLAPEERSRLTTLLVDQRTNGKERPTVGEQEIERAKRRNNLPVHERASRLLKCLAERSQRGGEIIEFPEVNEVFHTKVLDDILAKDQEIYLSALAESETLGNDEMYFLTDYLAAQGWIIKGREIRSGATIWNAVNGTYLCFVTVPGYHQVEQLQAEKQTSQCFVAMWFDRSMDEAYDYGIEPAVEQAGYTPMRIDRKEDLIDKIDDAIIAEIRRSRFLIADFTHGEQGARGGVYYEAGFAQGIGIPVIFLCQNDRMEDVHFDTRQFFHIVWDSPGDLKEKLYNRIVAYMGEGPESPPP